VVNHAGAATAMSPVARPALVVLSMKDEIGHVECSKGEDDSAFE
jgi:hypothetical protein